MGKKDWKYEVECAREYLKNHKCHKIQMILFFIIEQNEARLSQAKAKRCWNGINCDFAGNFEIFL